jgi:predicted thioesterase
MSTLQIGDWHSIESAEAPSIIDLMELAAARAMERLLGEGEHSIGVSLELRHAARASDAPLLAAATFLGGDGKCYRFSVEAYDERGLVGQGEHTRAILPALDTPSAAARM